MFLALILIHQVTVTFANPYSKYPFVFLLNAGNEYLGNTDVEKIRVSIPSGSVVVRYPAFGYVDTITNVRVAGIDSGKNIKVKIIEGGPGFNYVVLAFLGNSAGPSDVLVTLQTRSVFNKSIWNDDSDNSDPYGVKQDINDSSEDTSDEESPIDTHNTRMNEELLQSSSNIQNYGHSDSNADQQSYDEDTNNDDEDGSENEDDDNTNDFENEVNKNVEDDSDETDDIAYAEDIHTSKSSSPIPDSKNQKLEISDSAAQTDSKIINQIAADRKYGNYDDETEIKGDNNLFREHEALKSHLYYHNIDNTFKSNKVSYEGEPVETDEMFNDEDVTNYEKFSDRNNNNNNFDTDDNYAVEY